MHTFLIILCGGTGSRMNMAMPKQFYKIKDKTILSHCIDSFLQFKIQLPFIIVSHPELKEKTRDIVIRETRLVEDKDFVLIDGGKTRHLSSLNGANAVFKYAKTEKNIVLFHDAARPIVQKTEFQNLIDLFKDKKCKIASLAGEVTETILQTNSKRNKVKKNLNRANLISIKTPQAICIDSLKKMIKNNVEDNYTDLLTFGLAHQIKGRITQAASSNIKLTRPEDVSIIQEYL